MTTNLLLLCAVELLELSVWVIFQVTQLLMLRSVYARGALLRLGLLVLLEPLGTALLALPYVRDRGIGRVARWHLASFVLAMVVCSWLRTWPWF